MAKRPWVTPQEVRDYSEIPAVQQRSGARLAVDIARAEQYVITYTHNKFEDMEEIPPSVKAAVLILSEAYGRSATSKFTTQGLQSETFDDYSYTAADGVVDYSGLGLAALLDDFVITTANHGVFLRMRKL